MAAGVGTDENGMGSAFGDFDRDGDLDWFVTSIYERNWSCESGGCGWGPSGNRLYRNDGNRQFTDVTDLVGVRNSDWGWGASFLDLENDGDLDLAATNGVFFGERAALPFHADRTRLWIQGDGLPMQEVGEALGVDDLGSGKGLAPLDFDRDGDSDLLISRNSQLALLLENRGPSGSWLQVTVEGTQTNRAGLGAIVRVTPSAGDRPLVQEVGVGTHFLAQDELALHFGLGPGVDSVDQVEVTFPRSGVVQTLREVAAGQRIHVRE